METGTQIKEIIYEESGETFYVTPKEGELLLYISVKHPDHMENWVILYDKNNAERVRWNTKYLKSIESKK